MPALVLKDGTLLNEGAATLQALADMVRSRARGSRSGCHSRSPVLSNREWRPPTTPAPPGRPLSRAFLSSDHSFTSGKPPDSRPPSQAPDKGMVPAPLTSERYQVVGALNWVASELHAASGPLFGPASDQVKAFLLDRLKAKYAQLNDLWLAGGKHYLVGDKFSIADSYWCETNATALRPAPFRSAAASHASTHAATSSPRGRATSASTWPTTRTSLPTRRISRSCPS